MPEYCDSPPPPRRGVALLAWLVILALVIFEVAWPYVRKARLAEAERIGDGKRPIADFQIRYAVGAGHLAGDGDALYDKLAADLNTGPVAGRLPLIVLAGELKGPGKALSEIDEIRRLMDEEGAVAPETAAATLAILKRLYGDYRAEKWAAPSVAEDERALLRHELGWTGRLALTPKEGPTADEHAALIAGARRFAVLLIVLVLIAVLCGLIGLVAFVTWIAFFVTGQLRQGLPRPSGNGGLYAEAFAVYMVVFLGLSFGRAFLLPRGDGPELPLSMAGMLLALAAGLFWPVLRGVPFATVRREIGLTWGRHPLLEGGLGLFGYILVLPSFAVGVLVSIFLLNAHRRQLLGAEPERYFGPLDEPSHPINEWLRGSDWSLVLQIVILASLLAPLVEETMFRGVLYRHLREATASWGRSFSFVASAAVVSFIFAIIHPQGALAAPALMGLAFGLNVLREWRGSLVPSMMVHGIHNGIVTAVMVQGLGAG